MSIVGTFGLKLATITTNFRPRHFTIEAVMEPLARPQAVRDEFFKRLDAIEADRHLSEEGKHAARAAALDAGSKALAEWRDARVAALDANVAEQRAAIAPPAPKFDPRRVELLATRMQGHSAEENATFYAKATDEERQLMEAANALLGRLPTKTEARGLQWQALLDADVVNEAVAERAAATNPEGVERLRELTEIRDINRSVAGLALAEMRDAFDARTVVVGQ